MGGSAVGLRRSYAAQLTIFSESGVSKVATSPSQRQALLLQPAGKIVSVVGKDAEGPELGWALVHLGLTLIFSSSRTLYTPSMEST